MTRREKYIQTRNRIACKEPLLRRRVINTMIRKAESETDEQFCRTHRVKEDSNG